jgi:CBS-domain-containing membrane protein
MENFFMVWPTWVSDLFHRHQPRLPLRAHLHATLGVMLAIGLLSLVSYQTHSPWLMAPFGASAFLIFALPTNPLAQPINVVAGYLIASGIGVIIALFLPNSLFNMALACGLATLVMHLLRVSHPPAVGCPILVIMGNHDWLFLIQPVLEGSILLVVFAIMFHRLFPPLYRLSSAKTLMENMPPYKRLL